MPIYEYQCTKCGHEFEAMQKISDKPLSSCPECKGKVKKVISNTSFVLKGSGWYADGYASPEAKKTETKTEKPGGNGSSDKPKAGNSSSDTPKTSTATKAAS